MSLDQQAHTLDLTAARAKVTAYERTFHNDSHGQVRTTHGAGIIARDEWPGTPEWHARRNMGRLETGRTAVAAVTEAPNDSRPADEPSE